MVLDAKKVVVLDNGSGNIKVETAASENPRYLMYLSFSLV